MAQAQRFLISNCWPLIVVLSIVLSFTRVQSQSSTPDHIKYLDTTLTELGALVTELQSYNEGLNRSVDLISYIRIQTYSEVGIIAISNYRYAINVGKSLTDDIVSFHPVSTSEDTMRLVRKTELMHTTAQVANWNYLLIENSIQQLTAWITLTENAAIVSVARDVVRILKSTLERMEKFDEWGKDTPDESRNSR